MSSSELAETQSDSDDLEDFEDAEDSSPVADMSLSLQQALEECRIALDFFCNNNFTEARGLMVRHINTSVYHSLYHSFFLFMDAISTFEDDCISKALQSLKKSVDLCNSNRKKPSLSESLEKVLKKEYFELFTIDEAHYELCYAECLLMKAIVTVIKDETLTSLFKAGISVRSCYQCYKDCNKIFLKKNWDTDPTRVHFVGGVKAGIGGFNLMLSMFPARAIKILQFIGFSADREKGIKEITEGCFIAGNRQLLCTILLLIYNLAVIPVLGHGEADIKLSEEIVDKRLEKYPKSAWFLFLKGRVQFLKGKLNESLFFYINSWKSQNIWPQFHHVCFWELMWVHCINLEWKQALQYISELISHSKWSRTIYSYLKATILLMQEDLTTSQIKEMENLMQDVPKYKKRIAGKSLPMEKFAVKKAKRYFSQNCTLVLPVIELMFLFNLFKVMKTFSMASSILKIIEKALNEIDSKVTINKFDADNKALVLLLQGALLRRVGSPLQAISNLEVVIEMKKSILEDHYIIPYAIVELALAEWDCGNKDKAVLAIEDVRKNYKGYSLESRLHFKMHTALTELKKND